MPPTAEQVREQHPDWSEEQVQAALAPDQPEPAETPEPAKQDPERDRAFAEMRRRNEELQRKVEEAERERQERERKEAEEQGEWQRLAEEERTKRETLEQQQREAEQRRLAERAAADLQFKDTGYALYLLQQDRVDLSDAAKVRETLEGLTKSRSDLVSGSAPPPSGGPAGGAKGDPPGLTAEQIAAMTPRQLAEIDPAVIKKALGQ